MSIVIAVKTEDRVVLMTDSAETTGEHVDLLSEPERRKILVRGDVLVGSVGKVHCIRRLVSHAAWFDTKGAPFDKRFIVENIVPKFFEDLEEHDCLGEKNDEPYVEASFLMACKDKLFYLDRNFAVFEVDRARSIGCTSYLLYPLISDIPQGEEEKVMLEGMRLSNELSDGVKPPFLRIDTVNKEYSTIKE